MAKKKLAAIVKIDRASTGRPRAEYYESMGQLILVGTNAKDDGHMLGLTCK